MEEPGVLIRWVTWFFASGHSATCGAIGIVLTLLMALWPGKVRGPRPALIIIVLIVCTFLVVCGSPALPYWYLLFTGIWIATLLFYWLRLRFSAETRDLKHDELQAKPNPSLPDSQFSFRWLFKQFSRKLIPASPAIWLLIGLPIEVPYQIWWSPNVALSRLMVIGDSVTAGLNDGEVTWPKILPRDLKVELLDASQPGATLKSARQQNDLFAEKPGLLVLEIGGNDLLEGLPVEEFERNLDQLLSEVNQSGRTIVMFELPLPPLCARYGAIQRRLARIYDVYLIPKRYFVQVLTTRGATVDGIHLSASGQAQLARLIASLIVSEIEAGSGTYQHLGR